MDWSVRPDQPLRLAIGSFLEEYNNKVEIVKVNPDTMKLERTASFDHPYPTTNIKWMPDTEGCRQDLLATTGDYLRLWEVREDGSVKLKSLLNNNKKSEFCAPLTSVDWVSADPRIVGTSSIDTTCTIWDIETGQAKTQLIAHDKEVYDLAFAPFPVVFASAGADGSVRMFDLRSLEHSTIIYESPGLSPLLRLEWNTQDHNYVSAIIQDANSLVVLDIRAPSTAVVERKHQQQGINAINWHPNSSCHLASGGDDNRVVIWNLHDQDHAPTEPMLTYAASGAVNSLKWSQLQSQRIAITYDNTLQILHT
jgi:WD repeat-containing protein 68